MEVDKTNTKKHEETRHQDSEKCKTRKGTEKKTEARGSRDRKVDRKEVETRTRRNRKRLAVRKRKKATINKGTEN